MLMILLTFVWWWLRMWTGWCSRYARRWHDTSHLLLLLGWSVNYNFTLLPMMIFLRRIFYSSWIKTIILGSCSLRSIFKLLFLLLYYLFSLSQFFLLLLQFKLVFIELLNPILWGRPLCRYLWFLLGFLFWTIGLFFNDLILQLFLAFKVWIFFLSWLSFCGVFFNYLVFKLLLAFND